MLVAWGLLVRLSMIAGALVGAGAAFAAGPAAAQIQDLAFNQYSVFRISPTAKYFTPGSIIRGYNFNGVLKVELICRHRVDIEKDDKILSDRLVSAGFFSQTGFQFNAGATVVSVLNADFGGNLVRNVVISMDNVTVYEYSAEDLAAIRKELLSRPACLEAVRNPRNKFRDEFNGAPAGLFQNQRIAIGNVVYRVDFNRDNPKAASLQVQAQVTKQLQVKFGLNHLNASGTELKGDNVVIGLNPIWQPQWN